MSIMVQKIAWEDWKSRIIAFFSEKENVEIDDITVGSEVINEYISLSIPHSEILVFRTVEKAKDFALRKVRDDLENNPELFDQNWLSNYLSISDTDQNSMINDEIDTRWSDLKDSGSDLEEKAEEYDLRDEYDYFINGNEDDYEVEDLRAISDDDVIEKIEEEFAREIRERWEEGLKNPVQFFVKDEGIYTIDDLMKASFISIDVNQAAEDAVDTDGIAHFLAGYDGIEIDLEDLGVAYRTD